MRKGSIGDSIFFVLAIFFFAVLVIFGKLVMENVNNELQDVDEIPDDAKTRLDSLDSNYATIFDYAFLIVVVLLYIATIVAGLMVDTHPAIFFAAAFLLIFVLVASAILANTFVEIEESAEISVYADQFTIVPFFMHHFVEILVVMLFSIAIVTYARTQL